MSTSLLLVGGGLANGLIAWRLAQRRPQVRVTLLEAGGSLGGNHTWSFHEHDLTAAEHAWLAPLVAHAWPSHDVRFPGMERRLHSGYFSITSQRFDATLRAWLRDAVRLRTTVRALAPDGVVLDDGMRLAADAVVDGRGPRPIPSLRLGWQTFVGLELRLAGPHCLDAPMLMDATVAQPDAYRFVYLLPFAADTVLVEDTCYADTPAIDRDVVEDRLLAYVAARGWRVRDVIRDEQGALPIVLGGDLNAAWADGPPGVARSGLAALLFHPTTGYSLPDAVRLADRIAALPELTAPALHAATRAAAFEAWRRRRLFRMLNRMLFRAAEPSQRRAVFAHFYRLPEPLVQRFYAGAPTAADSLRLLAGRPPVPVGRALRAALAGGR